MAANGSSLNQMQTNNNSQPDDIDESLYSRQL